MAYNLKCHAIRVSIKWLWVQIRVGSVSSAEIVHTLVPPCLIIFGLLNQITDWLLNWLIKWNSVQPTNQWTNTNKKPTNEPTNKQIKKPTNQSIRNLRTSHFLPSNWLNYGTNCSRNQTKYLTT